MPRRARLAVVALLALALGACTGPDVVTPPPGVAADPAPTAPTTAALDGSTRPRAIDISDVPPCDLLAPAQLAEFRIDGEPRARTSSDALFGTARTCSLSRFDERPALTLDVSLVTEYGIERFAEPGVQDGVQPLTIAGFPAVLSPPPPSMPDNCLVAVDVHPGQMIGVLLADGGDEPPIPLDDLCAAAPRVAEAVMQTLLDR